MEGFFLVNVEVHAFVLCFIQLFHRSIGFLGRHVNDAVASALVDLDSQEGDAFGLEEFDHLKVSSAVK